MLALACFLIAMLIATTIEMDQDSGGRVRPTVVFFLLLSIAWVNLMHDDESMTFGISGYILVLLVPVRGIMLATTLWRRWAMWRTAESTRSLAHFPFNLGLGRAPTVLQVVRIALGRASAAAMPVADRSTGDRSL